MTKVPSIPGDGLSPMWPNDFLLYHFCRGGEGIFLISQRHRLYGTGEPSGWIFPRVTAQATQGSLWIIIGVITQAFTVGSRARVALSPRWLLSGGTQPDAITTSDFPREAGQGRELPVSVRH